MKMTTITRRVGALAVMVAALGLGCGRLQTRDVSPNTGEAQDQREFAATFSLANDDGSFVSLDELLADGRPAVLVFYRGHW